MSLSVYLMELLQVQARSLSLPLQSHEYSFLNGQHLVPLPTPDWTTGIRAKKAHASASNFVC
jgi:hypothetical protein